MRPIHHEAITPDENDDEFGWDVIEDSDGFNVYARGSGMVITIRPTLKEAVDYAYELEAEWLVKQSKR